MKQGKGCLVVWGVLILLVACSAVQAAEYSLEDLCRTALERSERLKIAEENLTISQLGSDKALSALLPRLTATAGLVSYSQEKYNEARSVIQPNVSSSWGLRLDETLSLGGRELTALKIASGNEARARHELTALQDDYLLNFVVVPYYNVLMARKNLEIAETNLERLARHRLAAEHRLKIGEATKTVMLRAESELSGAKSERLQAANNLELALSILSRNVGLKGPLAVKERAAADDIPALEDIYRQAFAERADLKGLEVQKGIASWQRKYSEGAFWPNVTISAGYAGADQDPPPASLNRESIFGGLALSFPFFEGGLRKAELAEAKARERQVALSYEDLRRSVEIEIRAAYLDLVTQKGNLQFLNDQLTFARDHYHAVTRQFEMGLSNSLDVIDANTQLVSVERKLASAAYNYQLAYLKLKKAAGSLRAAVGVK